MSRECQEFRGLAAAAALGALDGPELDRFRKHLAGCPSCHAEFERCRRTLELAGAAFPPADPQRLASRIVSAGRSALEAEAGRRRLRLRLAAVCGAAAALLAVAGLVWVVSRPEPDPACGCWRFVDGDSGNSRQADVTVGLVPERVAWEQSLTGLPGSFKPLAWKGLVVVGADPDKKTHRGGGRLTAFGATDGRVVWERDFPSGDFYKAKGFPDRCISDGRMYVTDGEACLVLEVASGRDLARIEAPGDALGWSYLAASDGKLYGTGRDGRAVFCIDAQTGSAIWTRRMEGSVFVPALAGGRLYCATGGGELLALDAASGSELWARSGAVPAGRSSLHARGGRVLVLSERDELLAFRAEDGLPAWTRREAGAFASGLAFGSDAVYLRGGSLAVRLADGGTLWQQAGAAGSVCAAPTVTGGRVLATAGRQAGSLSSLEGASGRPMGVLAAVAVRSCDGAIVAGGRIFTVTDGRLLALACRAKG
ncbi:MAG TPA: PQQ-like beta-propeller repeat protein [Planctomycetota bacterium]|nr:PQQ-like beta-propeller repeat protein [Planctomycetota bacterium]